MDCVTEEGSLPHDAASQGPPTLIGCPLDFGNMPQGSRKMLQQVIANITRKPMIWLADAGKSRWLCIEPDHGILQPGAQQPIRVTADTTALAVGEYSVTLTFSSEGDETSMSKRIPGNVTVGKSAEPPTSFPLAAGLHLGWLTPQSTHTAGLVINNPDSRPMNWEITIGTGASGIGKRVHFDHLENPANHEEDFATVQNNGLILSANNGSLNPGESVTIYVTANANSTELAGDYSYTTNLTLTSKVAGAAGIASTSVQVPVTFDVSARPYNDGGPKVPTDLPPDPNISFTIPKGSAEGTTSLSFTNTNNSLVYWTLKPDPGAGWLVPNPSSGKFNSGEQASIVLTAKRAGLQVGPHSTNLNLILSWSPGSIPPKTSAPAFPVKVTVA